MRSFGCLADREEHEVALPRFGLTSVNVFGYKVNELTLCVFPLADQTCPRFIHVNRNDSVFVLKNASGSGPGLW